MTTFQELWARAEAGDEDAIFALVAGFDRANRPGDSLAVLMRAAERGNVLARLTVGARAIAGGGPQMSPAQAVALIESCAQQGNQQAAEMLAGLIGIGYAPGGIEGALAALLRAAQIGSESARRQLAILEGFEIHALLATPDIKWLSQSPRIGTVAHFINDGICAWLIERAAPGLQRAQVYGDSGGTGQLSGARTNSTADFTPVDMDVLMGLLWRRIARAAGLPVEQVETFSVLHYFPGEEFKPHYDFHHPDSADYRRAIAESGQRVLTCLIYLNDDYAGGETAFPRLGISHKGVRGEALFFFNVGPDGTPDFLTLHAGSLVSRGEKWLASVFVRDKPMFPLAALGAGSKS